MLWVCFGGQGWNAPERYALNLLLYCLHASVLHFTVQQSYKINPFVVSTVTFSSTLHSLLTLSSPSSSCPLCPFTHSDESHVFNAALRFDFTVCLQSGEQICNISHCASVLTDPVLCFAYSVVFMN